MDIEFHYHITYILVKEGGYSQEDASIIAYASQFTDDNNDKYEIILDDGSVYNNYISQTLNILRPKNKLVRIYTCFHFFPGEYTSDEARRIDGALHLFNTTPNSQNAQKMFEAALDTGDPYRVGIATHCYADTWAHQNFVGFKHALGGMKGMLQKVLPNIGHADAKYKPDIPNLKWDDPRLMEENSEIHNKDRFLLAAKTIFASFAARNNLNDIDRRWADLAERLDPAIGEESADVEECKRKRKDRIQAYHSIAPDMPIYDSRQWLEGAVEPVPWSKQMWERLWLKAFVSWKDYRAKWMRTRNFIACRDFKSSHWHKFQQAVKEHQSYVMGLLHDRYEQIGAAVREVM